jgi:hypothetical protein
MFFIFLSLFMMYNLGDGVEAISVGSEENDDDPNGDDDDDDANEVEDINDTNDDGANMDATDPKKSQKAEAKAFEMEVKAKELAVGSFQL